MEEFDNIIKNLKNNFLFQASLGSKELFHSNMLAWLLEQKNDRNEFEVLKFFIKQFTGEDSPTFIEQEFLEFRIEREEQNIDLTIKWKDGENWKLIFIENKMKSIPTTKQLEEYDVKIKKFLKSKTKLQTNLKDHIELTRNLSVRFLLTPFLSSIKNEAELIGWKSITYSNEILTFLKQIINFNYAIDDVPFILNKYISFIENQLKLLSLFALDELAIDKYLEKKYDYYTENSEEEEIQTKNQMSEVRKLRLHDLVLKLAHSRIKEELENSFRLSNYELKVGTAFSNSSGITTVDTEIIKGCGYFIGLQLQGNQLRYILRTNKKSTKGNELLAVQLFIKKLWFYDLDSDESLEGKGRRVEHFQSLGLKEENGKERVFCEYNNGGFLYLYKRLDKQNELPTIRELIDLFTRSFEHYYKNRDEIIQIIKSLKN
jgi:hypothetical protein